jgi:uncharacterized protein
VFRGEQRTLVRFVAGIGLVVGGLLTWLASSDDAGLGAWRDVVSRLGSLVLALGYGGAVVAVFDQPRASRAKAALAALAPLGRMALTSYLTQSIVLSAIFYGWGLGLFGRLGEAHAAAIGITIFVVQIAISAAWLRRYRFGPVEWLWRSFTYGARQPMRR